MKFFDLTHTFGPNMPVYPGDPSPELLQIATHHPEGFADFQIKTGMHVGTHMDGPLHMMEGGKSLAEISVEQFFGKGYLIDARGQSKIDAELLENVSPQQGGIVLIMTGFYKKFGQPEYFNDYPEITQAFAEKMLDAQVKIVGLDTPSPDRAPFKIHKILLGREILIIENLANMEMLLPYRNFDITALPSKFATDSAPVRVVVMVK